MDWSRSFSGTRSPIHGGGLDLSARTLSKREMHAQQMEMRKLRQDVYRLQNQCTVMQLQMETMMEKNSKKRFFKWKKFGMSAFSKSTTVTSVKKMEEEGVAEEEAGEFGRRQTLVDMKTRLVKPQTPHKWSKSMS